MKLSSKNKKISEKGVVLYLAIIIMGIMMAISLALSAILVKQIKMVRSMGDSVVAFYAADSGMEQALKKYDTAGCFFSIPKTTMGNYAEYRVESDRGSKPGFCILKSYGSFEDTQRRIEVTIKE